MAANLMLNVCKKYSRGFSLVELMVALSLSLLLLAGVATIFVSSKGAYETNDRLARLEENGRFALDIMSREIRTAGYSGCTGSSLPFIAVNDTSHTLSPDNPTNPSLQYPSKPSGITVNPPVEGFNYTPAGIWTPALPAYIPTSRVNGSDILVVRSPSAGVAPLELQADMALDTDPITVTPQSNISQGQLLMIGDCGTRSYFEVTNYNRATGVIQHALATPGPNNPRGNWTGGLASPYVRRSTPAAPVQNPLNGGAQIYTMQTTVFYVALSQASQTEPDPTKRYNSLWRQVDGIGADELIEGVDSMQLLYGLDTAQQAFPPNIPSSNVANVPGQIVNVTIALLMRSLDQYGPANGQPTTYPLLGTADTNANFTAPDDRRQRQVFTTTVWVRNPQLL